MANFCKYCGKALQDGEICSCPQAQAEAAQQFQGQQPQQSFQQPPQGFQQPQQGFQQPPQGYQPQQGFQQPQQPAGPNPFVVGLQRIPSFLSNYLKAPVSAVQSLVNSKDVVVAGVLLAVQVLLCGLLLFSGLKSMIDSVEDADPVNFSTVVVAFIAMSNDRLKEPEPSFGMSFLMGILIALICLAVYVMVIFAAAKIAGSRATITDAIVAAGGHSLCVTVLLLLSFITFFMMFEIGAILFTAAMLFWLVLTGPAVQSIAPPNATKEGSLWICLLLGVTIAVVFCGWIASMMMGVPFK